ncbi:MAG: DNA translocase FtsK 4TM domain-containing protein, partial [Ignavibacteria bacterium]|nr:DNA translocase FtsK 4TM domain-containing protein [Ignavibacteria bacterium]
TAVGENFFIISPEKKKKIFGILLLLIALLSFLSILSYSRADESSLYSVIDLFKILNPSPELQERIVTINNWLGLFGAYISYFLIHSTIGLFSIIFPAILFLWGWAILGKVQYKLALHISNFLLVTALLLSTFFGLIRFTPEISLFTDVNELSGNVGASLGTILSRLLGGLGGIIFIGTGLAITLIIAFDVHFSTIINFIKELLSKSEKEEVETENAVEDESANANLDKIKNLRTEKTSKAIVANKSNELEEVETLPETKITIVQKDIPTVETKLVIKEENTNSKTSKTEKPKNEDDDSLPLIDKNAEAELPDQWDEKIAYNPPTLDLLIPPGDEDIKVNEAELKRNAALLKDKLALFDIQIDDITVTPGPVVTLYEIVPAPGVKISRIVSLEHDIALALAARGIRIIAPI